ncbi:MAG: winged helix-turn-helix domain-containing protein [Acidobacteria bacterium]|nr:winged helix-turn-helix domain-containing protein [Acidobacteriota bacterium]
MSGPSSYEFGPFRVDTVERLLLRDGQPVPLTPKAFETLLALVRHHGHAVEKQQLMTTVWPDTFVEENNLNQNISALRRALGEGPHGGRYIETVPRRGYRFIGVVREIREQGPDSVIAQYSRSRVVIEEEEHEASESLAFDPPQEVARERRGAWAIGPIGRRVHLPAVMGSALLLVAGAFGYGWLSNLRPSSTRAMTVGAAVEHTSDAVGRRTLNQEAHAAFLRGRFFWNTRTSEGLHKAIVSLERAVELDPDYALAYAALADAYAFDLQHWKKVEGTANRALALSPSLGEAHASLGFVRLFHEWDWPAAEREFRRAVALSPDYATAHQWYAICFALKRKWMEAKAEMRQALKLEPTSPIMNADMGQLLYFAQEYDEAIEQCRRALEVDSTFLNAHVYLYQIYTQKKMYREAVEKYFEIQRLDVSTAYEARVEAALRNAYAREGIRGFWRARLDYVTGATDYYSAAEYAARLGDLEAAVRWLDTAFQHHSFPVVFSFANPVFEGLHGIPRFRELMRTLGV